MIFLYVDGFSLIPLIKGTEIAEKGHRGPYINLENLIS